MNPHSIEIYVYIIFPSLTTVICKMEHLAISYYIASWCLRNWSYKSMKHGLFTLLPKKEVYLQVWTKILIGCVGYNTYEWKFHINDN